MNVLIELDRQAQELQNAGEYEKAIPVLLELIKMRPDYEHGMPYYNLACCYEDIGQYQQAKDFYKKALEHENSSIYLGGFAEHLYYHGAAKEALEIYLRYIDAVGENSSLAKKVEPIIVELRTKVLPSELTS